MSRSRVRKLTVVCVTSLLLVALALQPAGALASSGEFTRAEASSDWTLGSVAGSASWGGCEYGGEIPSGSVVSSGCSLQPYVTIGTSECSSEERRWPHSNGKLALAWSGTERFGGGSQGFDVSEVPLSGEPGQLACLTLLETYEARPYCQVYPGPGACPMWILDVQNPIALAEAPLTQDSTPQAGSDPPERPITEACPGPFIPGQVCGTLNPGAGAKAGYYFAYKAGTSCGGGEQTPQQPEVEGEAIQVSEQLTGLSPDTRYSVCLVATNSSGETVGEALTFETPNVPPAIESESPSGITNTDATLEAEVNLHEAGAYYQFQLVGDPGEYATEILCPPILQPGYSGCVGPQGLGALPIGYLPANTLQPSASSHASLDLAGAGVTLQPATTYHFRVLVARRVQTEDTIEWEPPTVFGPDQTFTTSSESPEPTPLTVQSPGGVQSASLSPTPTSISHRLRHKHRHRAGRHRRRGHKHHRLRAQLGRASRVGHG